MPLTVLSSVNTDAFIPFFFWLFVRDFPVSRGSAALHRVFRVVIPGTAILGAALMLTPVLLEVHGPGFSVAYFALLLVANACAVPVAIWKARAARRVERRRVGLFLTALAVGIGPITIEIAMEALIPGYYEFVTTPAVHFYYSLVLYPLIIFEPFGIAYAVLVHRVLDIKLLIRRAVQYALARDTVLVLAAAPFAGLAWYIYTQRHQTVSDLLSGRGLLISAVALLALVLLRLRRRMLDAIDRGFFHEQYDARRVLTALVKQSRGAATEAELAALLRNEIDRALHLESIAVLVNDAATGLLIPPDRVVRPLDASLPLAISIAGSPEPLDIDIHSTGGLVSRLSMNEREWLADGDFRLLVPMLGSDGSLVGMLALGAKKSELPFQREDRKLLSAIAASAALALENRALRASMHAPDPVASTTRRGIRNVLERMAAECSRCQTLYQPDATTCVNCAGELAPAMVPYILAGKFRFESKLGAGGMGVVYRATDLLLNRTVAIKTLPKVSPDAAVHLRREARAAARVSHPNLALIFGAETWHGTPMLVFEYLDGGTLGDRIGVAPLPPSEVLRLAIGCGGALEQAHAAGVLHLDIKPSNIGYNRNGTPKLLDFGVARLLNEARLAPTASLPLDPEIGNATTKVQFDAVVSALTTPGALLGTLAYLSPEAMRGERPDPSFDLWSLAVVLFEALTGNNPVAGPTPLDTMSHIRDADIPDIRQIRPDCPPGLAAFLRLALARDRSCRPATAVQFLEWLELAAGTTPMAKREIP